MKKSTRMIIVALIAAIVVAAAAIGTVLIVHRLRENASIETDNSAVEDQEDAAEQADGVNSDVIQFGSYPQACVRDEALIEKLNALDLEWKSYGYYNEGVMDDGVDDFMRYADVEYDGCRYRAVTMDFYRDSAPGGVDDDTDPEQLKIHSNYHCNTVYWFRYEPLNWRVLDAETGLLLCDKIIDAQTFSDVSYAEDSASPDYFKDEEHNHYLNDYTVSDIRSWLNSSFLTAAFTAQEQQKIETTTLDNSAYPKEDGEGDPYDFDCSPTEDKIFLLSYRDMLNGQYGFDEDAETHDDNRAAKNKYTDYALIQGLTLADNLTSSGDMTSSWMLRTPGLYTESVCYVGWYGELYPDGSADASIDGIRPAINAAAIVNAQETKPAKKPTSDAQPSGQTAPEKTTQSATASTTAKTPETTKAATTAKSTATTTSAATTKPATTKPATTKPATTKPAATKPAANTKPAATAKPAANGTYKLTVTGDHGTTEVTGGGNYRAGDRVTVTASTLIGYKLQKWASSDSALLADGTSKTYTFTMPAGNVSLKAQTVQETTKAAAFVKVHAGQGVQSVSGGGQFAEGASVTVSAVMMKGYEFSHWTENGNQVSNQKTYSFKMPDHSINLFAEGERQTFTVTVKAGTGISNVTGSGQYKYGERVAISAAVQQNYSFGSWSGYSVDNLNAASTSFTMPAQDVTLTASAKETAKYTVTVAKGEAGITSVSGGGTFYEGASVTVSCQLDAGYVFNGWYSSNSDLLKGSTSQSYSFKMPKGNVTLTAKATNNQFTVTVVKGTGITAVSGGGKFTVGSTVTVNCQIDPAYKFSGWSSSNTELVRNAATQSYSFKMPKGNVTLTAKAVSNKFKLTVSKGTGISSVTGGGTYVAGSSVTVSCTPSTGYEFKEWTSNSTSKLKGSTAQDYTFTMPASNITLTAKAEKAEFTLTLSKGTGIDSVSGGGKHTAGTSVTIDCTPKTGYTFVRWTSGNTSLLSGSTSKAYTFNMPKGDITLAARAEQSEYQVTLHKDSGISSISGAKKYKVGTMVTVKATPRSGYDFVGWYDENNVYQSGEATYKFKMPNNPVTLTANSVYLDM